MHGKLVIPDLNVTSRQKLANMDQYDATLGSEKQRFHLEKQEI